MPENRIPFFDLSQQHRNLRPEIEEALRAVLDSGKFILGPAVQELEKQVAHYVHRREAVGVSSGTDALLLSLMALEIEPGDAVLTTPFSFFATAGVIARLGAIPVFADIDPITFNLDPSAAERAVAALQKRDPRIHPLPAGNRFASFPQAIPGPERLKVILPVHLYGQAADMGALNALARRHGLRVVEDAAQSIGAEYPLPETGEGAQDNPVCYSFYPTKNLGGLGDAGMVATDNLELADKLRKMRVHGAQTRYVHDLVGGNFRLDTLQAAVLLVKLAHLDGWTRQRQDIASRYDVLFEEAALTSEGKVISPRAVYKGWPGLNRFHIYNQYVIRVQDRPGLQAYLHKQGVGTEVYYPVPFHLQPCFAYLGYRPGDFPEAERAAREALALPVYPELTPDQQRTVVEHILEYVQRAEEA